MILTVGNIKGGVGKTLLAVNIAAVLAHRGRDVLLIDGDEQGSAATFAGIRAEIAAPAACRWTRHRKSAGSFDDRRCLARAIPAAKR